MNNQWYYGQGREQFGPVTTDELKQLIATRTVTSATLVWTEGMAEWQNASTLPELFPQQVIQDQFAAGVQPDPIVYPAESTGTLSYAAPDVNNQFMPGIEQQVIYVGFWWRVLSYMIDYCIFFVPNVAIQGIAEFMLQSTPKNAPVRIVVLLGISAFQIIIQWLYFAIMESSARQATLGKMACGFIVVDKNGNRLTFGRATGRYFAKILSSLILCIGYMMVGWNPRKQGLHDQIAGTFVIKKLSN